MTELSVEVEAVLLFPAKSITLLIAKEGMTVPPVVIAEVAIVQVMLSLVVGADQVTPVAEPPVVISPAVNVAGSIASLKTTVKLITGLLVGSAWPAAWLTVTVGGVVSLVIEPTLVEPALPAMSVSCKYIVKGLLSVSPDQPVMSLSLVVVPLQLVHVELSKEHCGLVCSVSVKVITVVPLTFVAVTGEVMATIGAMVSLVAVFVPVPVLPAASVWCAVAVITSPSVRPERSRDLDQVPPLQVGAGDAVTVFECRSATERVIAKLPSQAPESPTDVLLATLMLGKTATVIVGAVVSITKFLLAPSEVASPGLAKVSVALLPAKSLMVAPFSANAVVEA